MPVRRRRELSRTLRAPVHRLHAYWKLSRFHSRAHCLGDVVDASLDLGTRGHFKVKALQVRSEIMRLAELVRDLAPRIVLEIGTARGGTLFIWAQLASERVISCDLSMAEYRRALYRRFPAPGSRCRITLLEGDSHSADFRARVREELAGEPVDLLFIDGDHTEAGVTADWNDYRALVRPGGLVVFHDIVESQPFETTRVHELWRRLRADPGLRTEEIVDDPGQCGFGIGVVRV